MKRWASATRVATTTSWPPRCCRLKTSFTAPYAPSASSSPASAPCAPIAAALDAVHGGAQHREALAAASAALREPASLPSARVLAAMAKDFDNSFVRFARAQSVKTQAALQGLTLPDEQHARFTE